MHCLRTFRTLLTHRTIQNRSRNFDITCFNPMCPFFWCTLVINRCVTRWFAGKMIGYFMFSGMSAFTIRPRARSKSSTPRNGLRGRTLLFVATCCLRRRLSYFVRKSRLLTMKQDDPFCLWVQFGHWKWTLSTSCAKKKTVHYHQLKFAPRTTALNEVSQNVILCNSS